MGGKFDFVATLVDEFSLLISDICGQSQKYYSVTKRIDAFVHARYWVPVPYRHCVQVLVVNTEAKHSILF